MFGRKRNDEQELTAEEKEVIDEVISDEDIEGDDYLEDKVDDDEDDYLDDKIPGRHVSISSIVLIALTLLLVCLVSVSIFFLQREYKKIFPSEWCSCRVNETYTDKIDVLGSDTNSFMVSPFGLDLSLIDVSGEMGFEPTQKLSIISHSNRGYQSVGKSDAKLFELSEEEDYKNIKDINENTGTEIMDYLGSDYELDKQFLDSDIINVVKLPDELKADVSVFDGEVYITGKYFKASGAFKVPYKDNIHELILYKDLIPGEDKWEETEGTLVVPKTSATYTTSSTQTVKSMFGDNKDEVTITQVIHFEINGSKEPENLEYTNKVGSTYRVLVKNKNTDLIVAGGVIRGEKE